jgi:hypothetical protein
MTDREIDPSLLPDTPPPSQDNTTTNAGADAPHQTTPAMAAPATASGAPGEEEPYPFTEGIEDGKPRTQVVVRPRPDLRTDAPDEAAPNGAGAAARARLEAPTDGDRKMTSARSWAADEVGPIDRLVEFVFPIRTFTDWLLVDPLNRGELFTRAIATDPAGVDAASARARAVGYTASRFTNALKEVVASDSRRNPDLFEQLWSIEGVIKASIAHNANRSSLATGNAAQSSNGAVLARRALPPPSGTPSPLLVPPLPKWRDLAPSDRAGSTPGSSKSIERESEDDDDIVIWAQFADDAEAEGRILSDERADHALVPGQRYAQRRTAERNLAITGHYKTDQLTETLLTVLAKTAREKGAGSGSRFGIDVHMHFKAEIEKLGLPGVHAEQSYDRRWKTFANYGLAGTIRTDVSKLEGTKTVAVWDLKTGRAVLRPSRAQELAKTTGVPLKRVIEINYVSRKALRRGW